MRVVVTLPDEMYEIINNKPTCYAEYLIKEGTLYQEPPTVAEIRTKIEKLKAWIPGCTMYGSNQIDGINMVLRILDKYEADKED